MVGHDVTMQIQLVCFERDVLLYEGSFYESDRIMNGFFDTHLFDIWFVCKVGCA